MAVINVGRRAKDASGSRRANDTPGELSDEGLVALFEADPESAWDLFIERYAGFVLSSLHYLGFNHDEAMDRFVYICEKLCEDDFRRLRTLRFVGRDGELVPWIRTVVKNLSVNWAWSVEGRRRLFKSIATLSTRQQRVFELYFWRGITPSGVHEQLCTEQQSNVTLLDVLSDLEIIFANLNDHQMWRLMSQLVRNREAVRIADLDPETQVAFDPRDGEADPEENLLRRERSQGVEDALTVLKPRQRLILQLRFEEALTLVEVAKIMSLSLSAVKSSIRSSLAILRDTLGDGNNLGDGNLVDGDSASPPEDTLCPA